MNDPIPDPLRWLLRRRPSLSLTPVQDAATKVGVGLVLVGAIAAVIDNTPSGVALAVTGGVSLYLALTEPMS